MANKLSELKPHEVVKIDRDTQAMRVPGGLIYTIEARTTSYCINSVFVPFTRFITPDDEHPLL